MKKGNITGSLERYARSGKSAVLWLLLAAVMLAILVPCFSLIWRDRTQAHTMDECRLLADAVLKQSGVEQKRIQKNNQFLRTYLYALNALSGWAWAYGGTDDGEISPILHSAEYHPDGVAVSRGEAYQVLAGDLPGEAFDAALERSAAERPLESNPVCSSYLFSDGGTVWITADLPRAGAHVVSRMRSVPGLEANSEEDLDLMKLAGSMLSDSGVGIAMVRLSDHLVL